jgi:putative transposase
MEGLGRADWPEFVNAPMTEAESEAIRLSLRRDGPYGTESWARSTAAQLGLQSSLRSREAQRRSDPENCLSILICLQQ